MSHKKKMFQRRESSIDLTESESMVTKLEALVQRKVVAKAVDALSGSLDSLKMHGYQFKKVLSGEPSETHFLECFPNHPSLSPILLVFSGVPIVETGVTSSKQEDESDEEFQRFQEVLWKNSISYLASSVGLNSPMFGIDNLSIPNFDPFRPELTILDKLSLELRKVVFERTQNAMMEEIVEFLKLQGHLVFLHKGTIVPTTILACDNPNHFDKDCIYEACKEECLLRIGIELNLTLLPASQ